MENFPERLSFKDTNYDFLFWSLSTIPSEKRYSLYEATKYGIDKMDFVPTIKFVEASECDEFTRRADRLGISYSILNSSKVGLSDPEVQEFKIVKAPVYKLCGSEFVKVEDEPFYSHAFPTEKMIDAAYNYSISAKRKIITEYLEEKLSDISKTGYICIPKCRFYPNYYLDTDKYWVKNVRYFYKNITYIRSYIYELSYFVSSKDSSKEEGYISHEGDEKLQAIS